MSVRKWNKWPAPFKIGALSLLVLAIILSITLLWSWNTYVPQNSPASLPYETFIHTTLSLLSEDTIADIKYKKLGKNTFSDQTFLVTIKLNNNKKKEFVVKILGQNRWLSHRKHIIELYRKAGDIGVSPKVFFADPNRGILILEYIIGRHISFSDLKDRSILKKLAHILTAYHERFSHIPPCTDSNSLYARVCRRLSELNSTDPLVQKTQEVISSYNPNIANTTITHNDLKISNILIAPKGRLYIIDWGEAHHGTPILDLANLSHHGDLTNYHEQYLLQAYFHRNLTEAEKADFLWYKNLSLLHTSAWALREGSDKNTTHLMDKNYYNSKRFKQLLHKFYQEGFLSRKELQEMGAYGMLCCIEKFSLVKLIPPLKKNLV